ncbi:hypothetical protein [Kitasatospora sp. NPDC101183]|uniref:hypothetical protein n=1 Tax=Kitasatospora sp. NPDC101183 TaxID=3364100 RepID=UPI003807AADB
MEKADVAAVFPELGTLARQAVRLCPRSGDPGVGDSSVGGALLWPTGEPWPVCEGPHPDPELPVTVADVRLRRALYEVTGRTPEQDAALEATFEGHLSSGQPNAMLPVAQLYARDVPLLPWPEGADVLQVLWCPLEHDPDWAPATRVVWRSSAAVGEVAAEPPVPADVTDHGGYVPEPCVVRPEVVTEYPAPLELEEGLRERIGDWCAREFVGASPVYSDVESARAYYQCELAVTSGWKAMGWGPWSSMDPWPMWCEECGERMRPLLTIGGDEEQVGVTIGRSNDLQLYYCPLDPAHPHGVAVQ